MLAKVLIAASLLIVVFVVVVALRPSAYRTVRSRTLHVSPTAAFAQANDLHHYATWNPWGKLDPAMQTTFDGPPAGPGAVMTWSGNNQVGAGRMTIVESRPNEFVAIRLEFLKPFPSTAAVEFTFKPEGNGSVVTWSMAGEHSFIPRAIGLFVNMDKMIGDAFDQGLADMEKNAQLTGAKN